MANSDWRLISPLKREHFQIQTLLYLFNIKQFANFLLTSHMLYQSTSIPYTSSTSIESDLWTLVSRLRNISSSVRSGLLAGGSHVSFSAAKSEIKNELLLMLVSSPVARG